MKKSEEKSTKVKHTTGFTSSQFSSVITMLVLPLLTYVTLCKELWLYIYIYIYIYIWWNNAVFVSALKNFPLDIISNSELANFSASELERNLKLSKIAEKNKKNLIKLVSNWETANWKRCASFVFHFQDLFRIKVCIRKVNLYFI